MPHDVAAALSMLHSLTQLTGSQLSLHTLRGGEAQREWLEDRDQEDYEEGQLELPAAPMPQHLTRLVLQGATTLPEDCSHLRSLQSMCVRQQSYYAWTPAAAALTCLTRLTALAWLAGSFPEQLCRLPALQHLELEMAASLPGSLSKLSRLTSIKVHYLSAMPPALRALRALRELRVGGLQQVPQGRYLAGPRVLRIDGKSCREFSEVSPALATAAARLPGRHRPAFPARRWHGPRRASSAAIPAAGAPRS